MITIKNIKKINYINFMALMDEVNRPPGGKNSIRILVQNTFLTPKSKVLDVGSNTGFVTFEIASLAHCNVIGIDISKKMISTANKFLYSYYKNLQKQIRFMVADAINLPFPNNTFDLVVSGGSTAFINNIPKAIEEYARVVKPWAFIGDINFYFHTKPPMTLIRKLNKLLNMNIQRWGKDFWLDQYKKAGLELYYCFDEKMSPGSDKKIIDYATYLVEKKHWQNSIKKEAKKRLIEIYRFINEEHKYFAYGIFILRKRTLKEVTLF